MTIRWENRVGDGWRVGSHHGPKPVQRLVHLVSTDNVSILNDENIVEKALTTSTTWTSRPGI